MSDPLTLARATPLGPYVPATEAMLRGWCGPVLVDIDGALIPGSLIAPDMRPEAERAGPWTVYPRDDEWPDLHDAYKLARSCRTQDIRLDTRREEVRDRLCRLGLLPHALRDHPGAAVAAGMGLVVVHERVLLPYCEDGDLGHHCRHTHAFGRLNAYIRAMPAQGSSGFAWGVGFLDAAGSESTVESAELAADLAALRLGCVLEEPDGYLIPLPGGGVGFVPKESP